MVEVAPLAFMRGRTLNDCFIILDEAQNTSPEQMQMFLTRLGFGSRIVVTGDITQIDLPRGQRSGLVHVMGVLRRRARHRVRPLRRRRRRPPQAGAADRQRLHAARRRRRRRGAARSDACGSRSPNRSGWRVDEARRGRCRCGRRSPGEGVDRGRGRGGVRAGGRDGARSTPSTARSTSRTDVLSFPLDGSTTCSRTGCRGSSATWWSARRSPQRERARRVATLLVHGALHLVGYDHETDDGAMLARQDELLAGSERCAAPADRDRGVAATELRRDAAPRPGPFRAARDEAAGARVSFNYAFEGVIYVRPHAAEHARALRWSASVVLIAGRGARRDPVRAAGADAGGLVRADRRDDQHGAREGDRRRHQLVRPARAGRQGRLRRRRADRGRERRSASATWCSPTGCASPASARSTRCATRRCT